MEVSVAFLKPVSIIMRTLGTSSRFLYLKELFVFLKEMKSCK